MTDEMHTVALMAATMHAAWLAAPARLPNPATADDIALEAWELFHSVQFTATAAAERQQKRHAR